MTEDKEKNPYMKRSVEGMIFKIVIVALFAIVITGVLSTMITHERNMMIGDMEVLQLSPNSSLGIAFILIEPHALDIEQNEPIYLAERTVDNPDCYTCNPQKPVKVIYTTSYAFDMMNYLGIIENAKIDEKTFHAVESALLLTLDQKEYKFEFDKSIVRELNRLEITPQEDI